MIFGLNGSTTVSLELADFLQSSGNTVTIYTYTYGDPAKEFFENANLTVLTAADEPELHLSDFDLVWVHSQVLPISLIRELQGPFEGHLPSFVFLHMSPFDWIPDERPYIFDLERCLASLSLYITPETHTAQRDYHTQEVPSLLFRNPAPVEFSKLEHSPRNTIHRILIVSNHIPAELQEAAELLRKDGIEVVSFGELSDEYRLVTATVLDDFDVVISIGKTVQYALAAGIPVFVYDHFGGKGYITEETFQEMADFNFAGRDSSRRSAEDIARSVISGYQDAVKYQTEHRAHFIEEFSIDRVLPRTLASISPRIISPFEPRYAAAVESAQRFARIRFETWHHAWNLEHEFKAVRLQWNQTEIRLHEEIASCKTEIEQLRSSKSFRAGLFLLAPLRLAKRMWHRAE